MSHAATRMVEERACMSSVLEWADDAASFKRLLRSNPGNVETTTSEALWLVFCR